VSWSARLRTRLGGFTLDVQLGSSDPVLALVGPNGSGKTTVLRALAGAVPLEEAEIVVEGRVLASRRRGVDVPTEERRIGYVPQGYGLFGHLDAVDNVAFGLRSRVRSRRARRERARDLLDALGCGAIAERRVRRLSGGEQQRVALARALVIEPDLVLLDEPLTALDASTRRSVRELLVDRLRAYGRPAILVTHDLRDIEAFDPDIAVIEGGRVVQRGSLASLRTEPATDFVAELVGEASGRKPDRREATSDDEADRRDHPRPEGDRAGADGPPLARVVRVG